MLEHGIFKVTTRSVTMTVPIRTVVHSLSYEISTLCDCCDRDVTATNHFNLRIFSIHRGQRGQSSLRDLLQPLVNDILKDKNININTNPLDVYKAWVNQMESVTGQTR